MAAVRILISFKVDVLLNDALLEIGIISRRRPFLARLGGGIARWLRRFALLAPRGTAGVTGVAGTAGAAGAFGAHCVCEIDVCWLWILNRYQLIEHYTMCAFNLTPRRSRSSGPPCLANR